MTMGRILRMCLQSMLQMVNSMGGLVGVAFILYGLWMMTVWNREFHFDPTLPWFIYTSLGLGISLCLITCFGHIAAETSNGRCISFYMVLIFLLIILEIAITADVILNNDWEEDFPYDTTGRFNEFKNFITSNFEWCQWVGLTIVAAQGISIFLAMILKAIGPNSDDDSVNARQCRSICMRNVKSCWIMPSPLAWSVMIVKHAIIHGQAVDLFVEMHLTR